jgi:hypothetical protein
MVFLADAVIYPDAMVIKSLDTQIANFAMLGPSRFVKFTSFTFSVFDVHSIIEFVLSIATFLILFGDNPRITITHFYKTPIAHRYKRERKGPMVS